MTGLSDGGGRASLQNRNEREVRSLSGSPGDENGDSTWRIRPRTFFAITGFSVQIGASARIISAAPMVPDDPYFVRRSAVLRTCPVDTRLRCAIARQGDFETELAIRVRPSLARCGRHRPRRDRAGYLRNATAVPLWAARPSGFHPSLSYLELSARARRAVAPRLFLGPVSVRISMDRLSHPPPDPTMLSGKREGIAMISLYSNRSLQVLGIIVTAAAFATQLHHQLRGGHGIVSSLGAGGICLLLVVHLIRESRKALTKGPPRGKAPR